MQKKKTIIVISSLCGCVWYGLSILAMTLLACSQLRLIWTYRFGISAQVHSSTGTNKTNNRQTSDVSLDYLQLFLYTSFCPTVVLSYSLFNVILSNKKHRMWPQELKYEFRCTYDRLVYWPDQLIKNILWPCISSKIYWQPCQHVLNVFF